MSKHLPNGPHCATCVIGGCAAARHAPQALGYMRSDGEMRSGVGIVAEALGHHEATQNKALVGPAGFFMGRSFSRKRHEHLVRDGEVRGELLGGWDRGEFAYYNSLLCQPAGSASPGQQNKIHDARGALLWWAEEALAHCRPNLDAWIDQQEPRAIVAFGDTAFHQLTGRMDLAVSQVRGYAFRDWRNRAWVIPTPHPARLMRGDQYLQRALLWDVDKARWIAERGYEYEQVECLADPPVEVWERYVGELLHYVQTDPHPVVATDIETPYKRGKSEGELEGADDPTYTILDISFCFERGRGVTVPWQMPYRVGVERIFRALAQRGVAVIWNRSYDLPRIRHNLGEWALPMERTEDAMDAWHCLFNTMDRGLGFATSCFPLGQRGFPAWKHLGQNDPTYRVMDSVALWRNYQDIMLLLDATGQRRVYEWMCRRLDPHLSRASSVGLLVDREMRDRVSGELRTTMAGLGAGMTQAVPEPLRPRKVWQTRKAAEKGLALLKEAGEVGEEATLFEVAATKLMKTCGGCGVAPITQPHVTKKTLKET